MQQCTETIDVTTDPAYCQGICRPRYACEIAARDCPRVGKLDAGSALEFSADTLGESLHHRIGMRIALVTVVSFSVFLYDTVLNESRGNGGGSCVVTF